MTSHQSSFLWCVQHTLLSTDDESITVLLISTISYGFFLRVSISHLSICSCVLGYEPVILNTHSDNSKSIIPDSYAWIASSECFIYLLARLVSFCWRDLPFVWGFMLPGYKSGYVCYLLLCRVIGSFFLMSLFLSHLLSFGFSGDSLNGVWVLQFF
jgi:hypothetical protein